MRLSCSGVQGHNSEKVNDLLRDSGGLVKIEDILPLFPDFAQVDNFKDAICKSLSDYNTQIEDLKAQMADATQIADALRCATDVPLSSSMVTFCFMP